MNKITLANYGNATLEQKADLNQAIDALNSVWNSDEFKAQLLGCTYNSVSFANTTETAASVWDKLHAADIAVSGINFYRPSWWQRLKGTISGWIVDGAENPDGTVSINADAWDNLALADRAAFIAHGSCHVADYVHDFQPTPARPFSVPYQVEAIITKLLSVKS